jgi:UDP-3-O-[3-hydroxymyristoyl] glucosamine N-acyltransferase
MATLTVAHLAGCLAARIEGDPDRKITGVASLESAGPEHLAFCETSAFLDGLPEINAGALLVPIELVFDNPRSTLLRVTNPRLAFAQMVPLFHLTTQMKTGIHPTAVVGQGAKIGKGVTLEPYTVIGEDVHIGTGTKIGASTVVAKGAQVGRDCQLGPAVYVDGSGHIGDRVVIQTGTRIGSEGFGYVLTPEGSAKMPQVGGCRVGDDVEIGANCTIDRGTLTDTIIGARTKMDNLVHVGHNVIIGEDCMIVAQVGLAGSVRIGDAAALGGQVGVAGHITIGPGAQIAGQSGVIRDVSPGEIQGGYPAQPQKKWLQMSAAAMRLPSIIQRLTRIEHQLKKQLGNAGEQDVSEDTTD